MPSNPFNTASHLVGHVHINQGQTVSSMVHGNLWLSSIKIIWLSWYLALLGANKTSALISQLITSFGISTDAVSVTC